jgi:hypothetical protein
MNSYYLDGVLAMSLGVNAYQVYKIDKFGSYSNILDQKDRMIQDGYNELLIILVLLMTLDIFLHKSIRPIFPNIIKISTRNFHIINPL